MADNSIPLSPGFRNILALINGKRSMDALLDALPQLDAQDLGLWCEELVRKDLIARKGELLPEDAPFSLTTDMSLLAPTDTMEMGLEGRDIIAEIERAIEAPLINTARKKLTLSGRMTAAKSAQAEPALTPSGFFIYSDAQPGLPPAPHVWVATHEVTLARLLILLIKRHGATTRPIGTRKTLSEQLRSAKLRPHILFLDAGMPELDAFRSLETIRTTPSLMGIRVVLMSPRCDRVDLARAVMRGAAGYLVKPLKRDVTELAIRQLFGAGAKAAS